MTIFNKGTVQSTNTEVNYKTYVRSEIPRAAEPTTEENAERAASHTSGFGGRGAWQFAALCPTRREEFEYPTVVGP